jgi:hypothetical protein
MDDHYINSCIRTLAPNVLVLEFRWFSWGLHEESSGRDNRLNMSMRVMCLIVLVVHCGQEWSWRWEKRRLIRKTRDGFRWWIRRIQGCIANLCNVVCSPQSYAGSLLPPLNHILGPFAPAPILMQDFIICTKNWSGLCGASSSVSLPPPDAILLQMVRYCISLDNICQQLVVIY